MKFKVSFLSGTPPVLVLSFPQSVLFEYIKFLPASNEINLKPDEEIILTKKDDSLIFECISEEHKLEVVLLTDFNAEIFFQRKNKKLASEPLKIRLKCEHGIPYIENINE